MTEERRANVLISQAGFFFRSPFGEDTRVRMDFNKENITFVLCALMGGPLSHTASPRLSLGSECFGT